MKTLIIAATIATLGTTVSAQDSLPFGVIGSAEYAIEAEVFESRLGISYDALGMTFEPILVGTYVSGGNFEFSGAELNAIYSINQNVDLYGRVDFDSDFDYDEFTIGLGFRF